MSIKANTALRSTHTKCAGKWLRIHFLTSQFPKLLTSNERCRELLAPWTNELFQLLIAAAAVAVAAIRDITNHEAKTETISDKLLPRTEGESKLA